MSHSLICKRWTFATTSAFIHLEDNNLELLKMESTCSHPVNFGGLCGVCGQDLTIVDATGTRKDLNVSIMMSHENTMLFVSKEEASRIENQTARRLLKTRKLSLILDLDQTVIHATVNPRISTDYLDNDLVKHHPSLRDISKFSLPDNQGFYHVKLRPHLKQFLADLTQLFELHIYTMGTRNYAKAIADIIDPDGTLFRERILSRDESGSFTQKSIQRLFPCDDSMVMVVDDRADVWNWSENLIKVRPFVFFRDTGDINDPAKLVASASESPILSKGAGVGAAAEEDSDGMWRDLMKDELPPPVPPESPTVPTGGDHEEDDDDRLMSDAPFDTHEQDSELITLSRILGKVHGQFYRRLDEHGLDNVSLDDKVKLGIDVKAILRGVKEEVFKNCVIVFSGVIPQGAPVEKYLHFRFCSVCLICSHM
eukprot:Partr_v1_DN28498_c3_g1_i2_m41672 putative RNA polymerase II